LVGFLASSFILNNPKVIAAAIVMLMIVGIMSMLLLFDVGKRIHTVVFDIVILLVVASFLSITGYAVFKLLNLGPSKSPAISPDVSSSQSPSSSTSPPPASTVAGDVTPSPKSKPPKDVAQQTHAPEHWSTTEGETTAQFQGDWLVTFDGSVFQCPPSSQYGDTQCKATASGNQRVVHRFKTTDDNPCTFTGTVDGDFVSGTYTCFKLKGPYPWHATIY